MDGYICIKWRNVKTDQNLVVFQIYRFQTVSYELSRRLNLAFFDNWQPLCNSKGQVLLVCHFLWTFAKPYKRTGWLPLGFDFVVKGFIDLGTTHIIFTSFKYSQAIFSLIPCSTTSVSFSFLADTNDGEEKMECKDKVMDFSRSAEKAKIKTKGPCAVECTSKNWHSKYFIVSETEGCTCYNCEDDNCNSDTCKKQSTTNNATLYEKIG